MRRQQVEARVLNIVEAVTNGQKVEDDRVELKAKWPSEHRKTARQLAAHANQAGGEELLWIIGLDENRNRVSGAVDTELDSWWRKVERYFDELSPDISNFAVPTPDGKQVHALVFDTSRAPYVVLNDTAKGAPEREVPWRGANGTRSARRSELLRSVVEQALVPRLESIRASIFFNRTTTDAYGRRLSDDDVVTGGFEVVLRSDVYVEATGDCTLPEHRWRCDVSVGRARIDITDGLAIRGPTRSLGSSGGVSHLGPSTVWVPTGAVEYVRDSGLHVLGSEAIEVNGRTFGVNPDLFDQLKKRRRVELRLELPLANSGRSASLEVLLYREKLDDSQNTFASTVAWFSADRRGILFR